jgi:hypothetical protein
VLFQKVSYCCGALQFHQIPISAWLSLSGFTARLKLKFQTQHFFPSLGVRRSIAEAKRHPEADDGGVQEDDERGAEQVS